MPLEYGLDIPIGTTRYTASLDTLRKGFWKFSFELIVLPRERIN
ncbi:MAG: hypothetical protein RIQ90_1564 [Bacteroidota bacterium]|jgi:hypothetical protein